MCGGPSCSAGRACRRPAGRRRHERGGEVSRRLMKGPADDPGAPHVSRLRRFLPAPGSVGYHALLAVVALFVLGPLGGITSAYMTFSLGFSVGGQVLAGILGSSVTYGYGAEGKHGANYIQTMAASVASMAGMGVLILSLIHISEPTRQAEISYAVF